MKKEYDFSQGKRGAVVPTPSGKTRITIRLDNEVIEWFRSQVEAAGGGNYQSLINQALRDHITQQREILEETLRRVLREEVPAIITNMSVAAKNSAFGDLYDPSEDVYTLADGKPFYTADEE